MAAVIVVIIFIIGGLITGGIGGYDIGGIIGLVFGSIVGGCVGLVIGLQVGELVDILFELLGDFFKFLFGKKTEKNHETKNHDENKFNHDSKSKTDAGAKQSSWEKYYLVLECTPGDDLKKVKTNYRRLVREYHPDHLGNNASESIRHYASIKMQEINNAYDVIKDLRV